MELYKEDSLRPDIVKVYKHQKENNFIWDTVYNVTDFYFHPPPMYPRRMCLSELIQVSPRNQAVVVTKKSKALHSKFDVKFNQDRQKAKQYRYQGKNKNQFSYRR